LKNGLATPALARYSEIDLRDAINQRERDDYYLTKILHPFEIFWCSIFVIMTVAQALSSNSPMQERDLQVSTNILCWTGFETEKFFGIPMAHAKIFQVLLLSLGTQ